MPARRTGGAAQSGYRSARLREVLNSPPSALIVGGAPGAEESCVPEAAQSGPTTATLEGVVIHASEPRSVRDIPVPTMPGEPSRAVDYEVMEDVEREPGEHRCGTCGWWLDGACHEGVPQGNDPIPIAEHERLCGVWIGEEGLAKRVLKLRKKPRKWRVRVTAQARVDYIVRARSGPAATREVWQLVEYSGTPSMSNPLHKALFGKLGWFGVRDAEPVRR